MPANLGPRSSYERQMFLHNTHALFDSYKVSPDDAMNELPEAIARHLTDLYGDTKGSFDIVTRSELAQCGMAGEGVFPCLWNGCGMQVRCVTRDIAEHMRTCHPNDFPRTHPHHLIECHSLAQLDNGAVIRSRDGRPLRCGQRFTQDSILAHLFDDHFGGPVYQCQACNKKHAAFDSKEGLKMHWLRDCSYIVDSSSCSRT